jgi:hypothetical protein
MSKKLKTIPENEQEDQSNDDEDEIYYNFGEEEEEEEENHGEENKNNVDFVPIAFPIDSDSNITRGDYNDTETRNFLKLIMSFSAVALFVELGEPLDTFFSNVKDKKQHFHL